MSNVEVIISPVNPNYAADDPRWAAEKDELVETLDVEVGNVRRETKAVPGQKGGIESIIAVLGSSGVIQGIVEIFKSWLNRDKSRKITVTVQRDGQPTTITVDANGIDKSTLKEVLNQAINSK